MSGRPRVVVFAKAPEPGRVKTRLTPALRAREAADLYRALLADTLDIADRTKAEVIVAYEATRGRRTLESIVGTRRMIAQPSGDLGARLVGVTNQLLNRNRAPLIVIGSDCPGVDTGLLRDAFRALRTADVVIGPALDGGYYLIGLKRPSPELFDRIPWSTTSVLASTLERAEEAGLRVASLRDERDIDTPEDVLAWHADARSRDLDATYPRTSRVLHTILSPRRLSDLEEARGGI